MAVPIDNLKIKQLPDLNSSSFSKKFFDVRDGFQIEKFQALNVQTFAYTGNVQSFTVPTGTTPITVDMAGAAGGAGIVTGGQTAQGGNGGRIISRKYA